ncbi:hypothetical protein DERF_010351 [Dermatophagoides farinae]|uniref:Uncharacterized protein n=1 Tax=Dermatophagoides farinae TaxID=6954 RepID=A0A922L6T2_DERFA|nr:hypothetical protein DERF_010351 [Dermatophagoides farinae]
MIQTDDNDNLTTTKLFKVAVDVIVDTAAVVAVDIDAVSIDDDDDDDADNGIADDDDGSGGGGDDDGFVEIDND